MGFRAPMQHTTSHGKPEKHRKKPARRPLGGGFSAEEEQEECTTGREKVLFSGKEAHPGTASLVETVTHSKRAKVKTPTRKTRSGHREEAGRGGGGTKKVAPDYFGRKNRGVAKGTVGKVNVPVE